LAAHRWKSRRSGEDVLERTKQGRLGCNLSVFHSNNIKVVCRQVILSLTYIPPFNATDLCHLIHNSFRPQNSIEISHGGETIVSYDENLKTVQLRSMVGQSGPEKDGFVFDRVFPEGTPQHELFDFGVKE
jgi:hypothetical protein